MRQSFIELQHREKAAREECKMYQRQLNDVSTCWSDSNVPKTTE